MVNKIWFAQNEYSQDDSDAAKAELNDCVAKFGSHCSVDTSVNGTPAWVKDGQIYTLSNRGNPPIRWDWQPKG